MSIKSLLATAVIATVCLPINAQKYAGGDISMLTKYEEAGSQYLDHNGNAISNVLTYFKSEGWNVMRLRLFVDPANATTTEKGEGVCQDLPYVKALGKRIKDAGLSLMLDFHYSDTWADPSKQWTPSGWLSLTDSQLYDQIYSYTKDALQQLKDNDATPDFIQIGNEISYGMLWGARGTSANRCYTSSTNNWERFTTLLKNAARACREVCPEAKIVVHTERVADTGVLKGFYDNMASYGVDYDIIGLSYYPYYHGKLEQLESALSTLENAFSKDIMIVETGYSAHWAVSGTTIDYSSTYPYTDAGQASFTTALINKLNTHSRVKGLFWWWPEANEYGNTGSQVTTSWYNATLFDNQTGRAYSAVSLLKNFLSTTAITAPGISANDTDSRWYNLSGQQVNTPTHQGVYIHDGKKMITR